MMNGKRKPEMVTDVLAIKKRIEDKEIRATLLSVVDANEDLLTELVGEEVLDDSTKDEILAAGSNRSEYNKRLLNWLSSTDDASTFEMFLAKLRKYGQNHVANLLNGSSGELPLKTKVRLNIQKIMGDLTKNIDPDSGLLDALLSVNAINGTAYDELIAERMNKASRSRSLLNILLRGSDKAFAKFLEELMKHQPLAMEILNKQEGEMTKPHVEALNRNHEVLMRCTDVNVHIIFFLRSEGVIDRSMEAVLRARENEDKLTLMYNWLVTKPVETFHAFIRAMQENEQKHVANLLSKNFSGQQPMSDENFNMLIKKRPHLMRGILSKGIKLASALRSEQASEDSDFAISSADYEDITQVNRIDSLRNAVLIDAILRRTDFSFDSLVKALEETNQEHMAKFLLEGEIVGAHINTTRPDKEDELSKLLNDHIDDPKLYDGKFGLRKLMSELNGLNLPIVAAEAKHSIMVYTYCKTPENMKCYVELLNSGRLQTVFENILNELLKELEGDNFQPLQAAVMLEEEDMMLIQEFTGLDGNETDFKNLPFISNKACTSHDCPMNVYCFDCKTILCSTCIDQDHQSHRHSDVQSIQKDKTSDDLCQQLQQDLTLVDSCKSKSLQWKEKIEKDREQFILAMEISEKAVVTRCENLKERVERFKDALLKERSTFKQQMLTDLDIRQRAIESYVAVYNGYEEYARKLMKQGTPSEICQSFSGLHERAEKLQLLPERFMKNGDFGKVNEWKNRLPQFAVQVGIIPTVGVMQVVHQDIPQPKMNPVEQYRNFLENIMDPTSELLEELSLPRKDAKKIENEHTLQKKNVKLLDFVVTNNKHAELIRALEKTKQSHIANFLNSNGFYNPQFEGDWPLHSDQFRFLDENRKRLVEKIQSRPLLEKLYSAGIISKKQNDFISDKSGFRERNEALLDLMKRGSLDKYRMILECLASDQSDVIQISPPPPPPQVNVTINVDVNKEVTELVGSVNQLIASWCTL